MKKQTIYLVYLLAIIFSLGNKSIAQIAPPTVYTSLSARNYAISDTIGSSEKWYKWTNDSAATYVYFKQTVRGSKYTLANVELYALESGSLTLINSGALGADSMVNLWNKDLAKPNDFYIKVITANSGCSICDNPSYARYNFGLMNLSADYSLSATDCELVVDWTMDAHTGGCSFGPAASPSGYVASAWHSPTSPPYTGSSPDYFYSCVPLPTTTYSNSVNTSSNFASNGLCTVTTNTSGGYSGLYASFPFSNPPYREYIYNKLSLPLQVGKTYHVSMWTRLSCFSRYATKDLNFYFTTAAPTQPSIYDSGNFVPSVITPTAGSLVSFTTAPVEDKTEWTILTACFTPTAAFSYLTIGNFQPFGAPVSDLNQGSWTYSPNGLNPNTHTDAAYYYFDNVSVIPLTLNATGASTLCSGVPTQLNAQLECPLKNGVIPTYSWTPSTGLSATNIPNPTANPSVTTIYTVTATIPNTDGSTCSVSQTVNVNVTTGVTPTLNITPTQTICQGASATLTVSGANTYAWNTGSNSATITVAPSSTTGYTVVGNSSAGCSATITTMVYVTPTPPVTLSSNTVICQGTSATLTASNSITAYTWAPSGSGSSITVTPSVTTTYTVWGTNSCGILNSAWVTITVAPQPGISISTTTVCAGSAISVTSNSVSQIDNLNFDYPNPLIPSNSQSPHIYNTPGTYSIQVQASTTLGSCPLNTVVPIAVRTATSAAMTFTTVPCTWQYTFLVNSGCTGGLYTFDIDIDNGIYHSSSTGGIGIFPYTFSSSGTHTIVVYSDYDYVFTQYIITVPPITYPTVTASASPATVCAGQSTTLTASGASSYTWNPGGSSANPLVVNPTSTTVYTVTGANGAGCTNTKTVTVTVNSSLSLSVTASPTAICAGNPTTLTATGATTYTWSTTATNQSITVNPTTTTSYTVWGTNAVGCTGTQTIQVNVTSNPSIGAVPSTYSICTGGSATLTASSGATSYSWNPGALTGSVVVVTPTVTTTYTLFAAIPGCGTKTATTQISVNPLNITASASPTAVCSGKSTTLTASGASTYTWNPGGLTGTSVVITSTVTGTTVYTVNAVNLYGCTATQTLSLTTNVVPNIVVTPSSATICLGASQTIRALNAGTSFVWAPGSATTSSITVTPTATTVYTVTGTNNTTGCSSTQTSTVVVNPFTIVASNPSTICAGQSATISALGASSYTWSTGANTSSVVVSPTVTTSYTVTGTGASCTSSVVITLTVNPIPTVTASASPTAICSGQSTTLTASGAASYSWNPGGATNPITVSPGTTTVYTVTGTSLGCSGTKTISVSVSATPTIGVVASPTVLCRGNTSTLTATGATNYSWSTGATTATIAVTPTNLSNFYTVTGTTGSCSKTAAISLASYLPPSYSLAATPSVICSGSTTTLSASPGGTFTWTPGAIVATNSLMVTPTITTVYTATLNHPCLVTRTVQVTVNPTPSLAVSASPTLICSGNSSSLTATGATNYTWNPGAIGSASTVVSPTTTTTYTVTGATGVCSKSLTVNVSVNPTPFVSIGSSTTNVCTGGTATLTAGGATSYTWNTGPTTPSVSVSPTVTTSYTVTGINAAGCTNTAVSTVTATPSSTISLSCSTSTAYTPSGSAVTASAVVSPPGTYDYVWEPNIGSTAVVTFTPTDNTVLNCNVSGLCANTVSSSCCVSVESSLCALSSQTVFANYTANGVTPHLISNTITVTGTLTIGGASSVIFDQCVLKMGTNAKIVVDPTSKLSISSSTVFSCEGMWEGIEAQSDAVSSATIELKGSTIEDAYMAVSADNASANVNNNITVGVSSLNKNYIDIAIKNAGGGKYPLTMFTSSLTSNASTTSPGNNLKCSSFYSPIVKARSYAGVYAVNGGTVDVNNNDDKTSENLFSNKDYGVYLDNTGSNIYYARFADAIGLSYTYSLSLSPLVSGVGVYSKNSDFLNVMPPTTPTTGIVTTFTNIGYGVVTNNTKAVDIENSDYSASSQSNIMDPYTYNQPEWATPLPVHYAGNGLNGIFVTDPTDLLRITNNTLSDSYYAVTVSYTTAPSGSNIMSVAQNTITASATGQVREGVAVNSAVSFTPTTNNMRVTVNTFSNVAIGVKAMNTTNGLRISNNSILLNTGGGAAPRGIYLLNNTGVVADNNTINGGYTGSSGTAYSINNVGVYSENSPGCKIKCNTITQTGIGVQYMGNNASPGDGLFGNTFTYPMRRGLWLSKGGLMGVQGNSVSASANVWSGFTNATNVDQTYVGGFFSGTNPPSSAPNSPLWVRNTSPELPTDNAFGSPSVPADAYDFSSFTLSASAPDYSPGCPTTLTAGLRVSHDTGSVDNSDRDADFMNYIENILPASNTDVSPQDKYLLKRYMFTALNREPSTEAHLVDFYQRQQHTSIDSYHTIDSLLAAGDVYTADARNMSAPVDNDITQTQNAYNALYVNGIHSANELKNLEAIADLCPAQYGTAVYQARALLQTLTFVYKQYNDSCGDDKTNARFGYDDKQESVSVSGGVLAKLLPNPNNGAFTLAYDLKAHTKVTVTVTDITGKLVYSSTVDNLNNRKQIHTEYLQGGIYFIQLLDENTLLWTDKLIISK